MFSMRLSFFKLLFPHLAECLTRRRAVRDAQHGLRRRQIRYARPRLEDLEERIVPDAYGFDHLNAAGALVPSTGAYTTIANWWDFSANGGQGGIATQLPGGGDTADIPAGAVCTLDSTEEQTVAALSVEGGMTIKSLMTVQTTTLSGSGGTTVAAGGLLDVTTPDQPGETSTLDTVTLTTFGGGGAVNLSIDESAEVEINLSATISGMTTVTGLLNAKNIDAFNGSGVILDGPGIVSGTGQLEAGINAGIIFDPASSWVIGPGNPVGSALKEGNFFVEGPLTVTTDLDPDGDITLDNDGGVTTLGSIIGSGSLDEWNKFTWNGGTLSLAGGATIEPQAEWKLASSEAKTLDCDLTNICLSTEFGGTGTLTITAGNTFLNASGTVAVSLPLITGAGTFTNAAGATVQISSPPSSGLTIASVLDNEGTLDCETGAGPILLIDASGTSTLNGSLALNNDSLVINSTYTTTTGFTEEWSPNDLTTLAGPGTLIVASGASADFDHMVIMGGGVVTGPGDFSIGADGLHTGNYLTWDSGTMSGTGTTTIGPYATLTIPGDATGDTLDSRTLDNHGLVSWAGALTIADGSGNGGPTIHNEKDGTFDVESGSGSSAPIPTFTNDGMLEVESGATLMADTFTQSSTGTLQSDIAGDSDFGTVAVTGTATLDGTLQANLENGYQPPSGTKFAVLTFGSSSGQFADVKPDGWSANYDPTDVTLVSS
jgi:hypothetical protein